MTSNIYIFIILFVVLVGLIFDCYYITQLYNNLDEWVKLTYK